MSTPAKPMSSEEEPASLRTVGLVNALSPIAKPLAGKKTQKHLYKLIGKMVKARCIRRGVKEVVKSIRKGGKGIVVLAGDISPIDVLSHLPVLCEESGVPYVFVRSRAELGEAASTKKATCAIQISPPPASDRKLSEKYERCGREVRELTK
jgi:H/ACA ribonucleoprotein complex subunit 2